MKTINYKTAIYVSVAIITIALVIVKLKTNKSITEKNIFRRNLNEIIYVDTDTIKIANSTETQFYIGTFEPNKESKLNAEVQGKINKVLALSGERVNAGQALVQLDNTLLQLQLQTVEVQIEGLEKDVNRYTILTNADAVQGVQLEKTTLGLKAAKVQQATLKEQINKTTIKAPFSGVITGVFNDEGAFASPGVPLLQISDLAQLKFTINLPETDLKQFKINTEYQIKCDAYPEIELIGKAIMIGSKSMPGNLFSIQFLVNNTDELSIKSGMFGKVFLEKNKADKLIVIPASALIEKDNQSFVYILKNNKAVLKSIIVAESIAEKIKIKSGLQDGDLLITTGFINLYDGANVAVNKK